MKRVMAQSETVERILDAAEQLFAEKGFAEVDVVEAARATEHCGVTTST